MVKKISPNRRRSIAVTNQNQPSIVPKARRRAHSIVPGAALSPLAKARRSLAPRKSILKASVNTLNVDSSSQPQSTVNSQSACIEDANATRSLEVTQDYTTPVHDNTSRKSLGRRVSFASHSYVRMFETNHTNSTGSPQSSPASASAFSDGPSSQPNVTNENDYPRQSSHRRRSSARYSLAQSEDMDLTSVIPGTFQSGSAILDEDFSDYEEDDYDNVDMDVTEAIRGDFARKRSLSLAIRQPLSQIPPTPAPLSEDADQSQSDIGNESTQSDAASEQSQAMEFTVPLGQSLRPADQDQVWLALKQATHSGNNASEPGISSDDGGDEMNLDDAMLRLRRARDSMSLAQLNMGQNEEYHESQDDSFTSTEISFEDDGNKTMNLSQAFGRASMAQGDSRLSMGYQDSNMDESEVYGAIVPAQLASRRSIAPSTSVLQPHVPQQPPTFSVFQPPPSNELSKQPIPSGPRDKATVSVPFSFTPKVPSPSKSKPGLADTPSKSKAKPTFSAAFAPPVSRPSPKKTTSTEPQSSPNKRPRSTTDDNIENQDVDKPSPSKRQALVGKSYTEQPTSAYKPKPLSPSKKAPFQPPPPVTLDTTSCRSSALRRPSGYYAKRKSLAVGVTAQPLSSQGTTTTTTTSVAPKKKPGIGLGRASLGSGPSDAWARFDKDAGQAVAEKPPTSKVVAKEAEAVGCVREAARQASASPSPTRGSPAPIPTFPTNSITPRPRVSSVEPEEPVLEQAHIAEPQEFGELSRTMGIDVDATQQWREGVQQSDRYEEDAVAISVAQFFSMTGIKFMDELTAPRRSIHPSQQPVRQPRNPSEIPLAEYVTAMAIDIPQLVLYSRVSEDLEGWMAKRKIVFAQVEEEAAKATPELFVEYARADKEGQAELLHQLNLIRTNTRYSARSDWYEWKLQWVEGLRVTAEEAFKSLENDAHTLEELIGSADGLIPELEQEYQRLTEELEREQAEVAEIESGDQDYLNELKATVAEQNIEIEALKAELTEGKDQLRWLQERAQELDAQKREAKNTIATAERILHRKKNSTRSEVFRLKAELEALEDLHMFRIAKVNADLFEYVYASLFHVSIPCKKFVPAVSAVSITRYGKASTRYKDNFPKLSAFLLKTAEWLVSESNAATVREIVHCLADYWSSCVQLRSQLTLLHIKYPVEIIVPQPSRENPGLRFEARTMVLFPSVMGKAFISFVFSSDTFSQWPTFIDTLDCKVDIAYGPLDRSAITKAVMERLSQVSPSDNYACLLDACIEAQDVYL